jgi:hypothetical protein
MENRILMPRSRRSGWLALTVAAGLGALALGSSAAAAPTAAFETQLRADIAPQSRAGMPRVRWFDAGSSTANGGSITSYRWSFGDGASPVKGAARRVRHTYKRYGVYVVTLRVTDSRGASATHRRRVRVQPPLTKGRPIGPRRGRVTRVIGWTTAAAPPSTGAALRALVPRAARGRPGSNLTRCAARTRVVAFLFRFAGLAATGRGNPPVVVTWRRDGLRISRNVVRLSGGSGLFAAYVNSIEPLDNGLYEVTATYRGRLLVRSYVTRTC